MGKLVGGQRVGTSTQAVGTRAVQPFTVSADVAVSAVGVWAHNANFNVGDMVYLKLGSTVLGSGTVSQTVIGSSNASNGGYDSNLVVIEFAVPITLTPGNTYTIDAPGTGRRDSSGSGAPPTGIIATLGEMLGGASGTTDLANENRMTFELYGTDNKITTAKVPVSVTSIQRSIFPMLVNRFPVEPASWGFGLTFGFDFSCEFPVKSIDPDGYLVAAVQPEGDYLEPVVGQIWPRLA